MAELPEKDQLVDGESIAVSKVCPHCRSEYETSARFCPRDGTALRPKVSDSLVGHILADRYHILKKIGEGGMGRVYLGEHVKMNRQCAIKVMSPALVNDAESASRFGREASSAARIIHPNVAAVFDYGEADGLVYLVMEFVDGEPLARLLAREAPLALERTIDLAQQISDGLGAAHELGIVHRDLKPDNILIARSAAGREVAKVVDFGIAKALQDSGKEALTRTGHVVGTPEFMSPEQLLGDPVDVRSDLYALGCIMHLMLTAAPPFQGETREQMIKRRLSEDASSVHTLDPRIPDRVAAVVTRLLARAPGDRYASAAEVRTALDSPPAALRVVPQRPGVPGRYTPRSAPTIAFIQATEAAAAVTHLVKKPRPVRRTSVVLAAIAAVCVIGVLWLRRLPDAVQQERAVSFAQDSALSSIAAIAPAEAPPPATAVLMVDTVLANARLQQKRDDSVARASSAQNAAVRAPILAYARAIESRDGGQLLAAYPAITQGQQRGWEQSVFSRADRIQAPVRNASVRVFGDSADVDFSLVLNYVDRVTKQSMSTTMRQQARLVRHVGKWAIVSIK